MIYGFSLIIFLIGILIMLTSRNFIRTLFGLVVFQNAVLIFYIGLGKVSGGIIPILNSGSNSNIIYTNPVPHVLMLTAIVVGFATLAVGLSLIYRIINNFGSSDYL